MGPPESHDVFGHGHLYRKCPPSLPRTEYGAIFAELECLGLYSKFRCLMYTDNFLYSSTGHDRLPVSVTARVKVRIRVRVRASLNFVNLLCFI